MLIRKRSPSGRIEARRLQVASRTAYGGARVPRAASYKVSPGLTGVEVAPRGTSGVEEKFLRISRHDGTKQDNGGSPRCPSKQNLTGNRGCGFKKKEEKNKNHCGGSSVRLAAADLPHFSERRLRISKALQRLSRQEACKGSQIALNCMESCRSPPAICNGSQDEHTPCWRTAEMMLVLVPVELPRGRSRTWEEIRILHARELHARRMLYNIGRPRSCGREKEGCLPCQELLFGHPI